MAFVGTISELFSCGRPRKPQAQDETKTEEDATRVAATLDPASSSDIRATPNNPRDNTHVETPVPSSTIIDPFPEEEEDAGVKSAECERPIDDITSTARASIESGATRDPKNVPYEATRERNEHGEGSNIDNGKGGKVWKIDQRILVTTRPSTGDSTPILGASPEPESQGDGQLPATVLAEFELHDATPAHHSRGDIGSDVESLEHVEAVQATVLNPELHQEKANVLELQKDMPSLASLAKEESAGVEVDRAVPPMQLLNLPTEIRKVIYETMLEENPIRMCRYDDPALGRSDTEPTRNRRRQFYNLTQVCKQIRREFLPVYEERTEYIIDLWAQKSNLTKLAALNGHVMLDIDAACFDMEPIDILPLIRLLARTRRTNCRFGSTEGVVFQSIELIVQQLNKLVPSNNNKNWLEAVHGPMKRIDLHLFPHEDIRQYYRFRGAEPMLRIVYPSAAIKGWMKQSHKSGGEYEEYLEKTGLDKLDMHVVVGHASRRTTNQGRLPLDWRLSYVGSRLSVDQAVRISGQWTR